MIFFHKTQKQTQAPAPPTICSKEKKKKCEYACVFACCIYMKPSAPVVRGITINSKLFLFFSSLFNNWFRLFRFSAGGFRLACFCFFILGVRKFGQWPVPLRIQNPKPTCSFAKSSCSCLVSVPRIVLGLI